MKSWRNNHLEFLLGHSLVKPRYAGLLILGSILGVATVIVVMATFANYYRAVERHLLGIYPHVAIQKESFTGAEVGELGAMVEGLGGDVVAISPAIDLVIPAVVSAVESHRELCVGQGEAAACYDFSKAHDDSSEIREAFGFEIDRRRPGRVRLRGIEVGGASSAGIERLMDVRSPDDRQRLALGPDEGMPMACLFGRSFFHGASRNDDLLVTLPQFDTPLEPARSHFRLLSTLDLGMRRTENPLFVTSLENAWRLLERPGFHNVLEVQLRDPHDAPAVVERIRAALSKSERLSGITLSSWIDRDAGSFRLLEVLRRVIFTVIFSVVVIAALGIVSSLFLVVLENRRKISLLKALGLRDRDLYLALILKCWEIAALALVLGTAAGWAASLALLHLPRFRDGLAKLGVSDPEVLLRGIDLALLAVAMLLLYLIVPLFPAREGCRIDPVEGLHR